MRTRPLGNTGLEPSELGFGCAGFWARSVFAEDKAVRLVHQAIDLGINFFDTSAHYGAGEAERRLGKALNTSDRDAVIVATKAGSFVGRRGRVYQDFTPESIRRSVEASLGRLGVDHVDLLQLHSPPPDQLADDLLDCLGELRRNGLIRACGVSGHGPELSTKVSGSELLATMMFSYNVIDADRGSAIVELADSGTGFIASMPLAQGRFRRRPPLRRRIADAVSLTKSLGRHRTTMQRARAFRFIEDIDGWTGAEVALGFVLGHPHVSTAVFGTTSEAHLAANVASCERTLSADITARINAT